MFWNPLPQLPVLQWDMYYKWPGRAICLITSCSKIKDIVYNRKWSEIDEKKLQTFLNWASVWHQEWGFLDSAVTVQNKTLGDILCLKGVCKCRDTWIVGWEDRICIQLPLYAIFLHLSLVCALLNLLLNSVVTLWQFRYRCINKIKIL